MPRGCAVCNHPRRAEIERDMCTMTVREIAEKYGDISTAAISRHRKHLTDAVLHPTRNKSKKILAMPPAVIAQPRTNAEEPEHVTVEVVDEPDERGMQNYDPIQTLIKLNDQLDDIVQKTRLIPREMGVAIMAMHEQRGIVEVMIKARLAQHVINPSTHGDVSEAMEKKIKEIIEHAGNKRAENGNGPTADALQQDEQTER